MGAHPSPPKGAGWIKQKYFDRVKTRDWWFFGDTVDAQGSPLRVRLFHAASVRIVRHVKVRSGLNPYDPSWTPYLSRRYTVAPHRARSWSERSRKLEPCELETLTHGS